MSEDLNFSCPFPINDYPTVQMAHGGGGRFMRQLLEEMFIPAFSNQYLDEEHDGAVLETPAGKIAFTTDSYVVDPLFFAGGNIGMLAVNGTVNDLAMCGATPAFLSAGVIIEEGFEMEKLEKIVNSMRTTAAAAGVQIVTGDTKVVQKGRGDGIYINTAGIGFVEKDITVTPSRIQPGDKLIVSGDVARHGMAVMSGREGLEFESEIKSDCAPLAAPVVALLEADIDLHCLRDLTRGGLASVANELADGAGLGLKIEEAKVPLHEDVEAACEILGFDPFYVACEGCMLLVVPADRAEKTLKILHKHDQCREATVAGEVTKQFPGRVELLTRIGTSRSLDLLSGEQLPRIC
ncbi:MAG: hydrogenase expression/formation protein HypE [bacterium]